MAARVCGGTSITPAYQFIKAALKVKEDKAHFYLRACMPTKRLNASGVLLRPTHGPRSTLPAYTFGIQ